MTLHEPKHAIAQNDSNSKVARTKLPAIPDLRFEYSYLKNVQPFVKITRVGRGEGEECPREIIEIEWRRVLWVTLRDQVIHPLVQGTLWGFASVYLKPLSARLGFGSTKSIVRGPGKDGDGVSWLRDRWQKLGFRSSARPSLSTT